MTPLRLLLIVVVSVACVLVMDWVLPSEQYGVSGVILATCMAFLFGWFVGVRGVRRKRK